MSNIDGTDTQQSQINIGCIGALSESIISIAEKITRSQVERVFEHAIHKVSQKDQETSEHLIRLSNLSGFLAVKMSESGFFPKITPEFIDYLKLTAPLHDIGKTEIPDSILLKRGKLTPEEWKIMKSHTTEGLNYIKEKIESIIGSGPILKIAKQIAIGHHEKWDGSGYPKGLQGENIPLEARVVAVADVFDALLSKRPYKEEWHPERVFNEIKENLSGTHFDPNIANILLENFQEMVDMRLKNVADEERSKPKILQD